jgi:elongation factor P
MALSITDLKKGTVFALDGTPYRVVEYRQKVMGRGGSIVNVKIKSLTDGKVLDKTFKGSERLDSADITTRTVQYLYGDGTNFHFMDPDNYEQFELPASSDKNLRNFIKEGANVSVQFFNDRPIGVELPKNVNLEVTHAEQAVKGDTSGAVTKNAELETRLIVKVPAFIKTGDIISVDTATGAYRERQKG